MIKFEHGSTDCLTELISKLTCAVPVTKKRVLNIPASFDTEVSSFYDDSGEEVALCYVWMFGVDDVVVYGRTLDEFREFITILNSYLVGLKYRLIVYIHNMKYDFQFIRTYFNWSTVFMKKRRDPLYARTGNIEFRDSLVLAGGRSLKYIGEHLKNSNVRKAVGDLDYSLLRHSETPLTEQELHYCENDILVLNAYIQEKIYEEGYITDIPYTNTGYVRRYVKRQCLGEHANSYRDFIDNLTITPGAYQQCENAFVGGAVGPNNNYVGKIVENVVSYDIKSSYPYVMVTADFPMGYPEPVANKDALLYLNSSNYCCIFRLHVDDLFPKKDNDYCYPISEDKCRSLIGARVVSNRVVSATHMSIECTELDYDTFCKFYDINPTNSRITNMRVYPKGKLPVPIIKSVFEFFNKKTTLDGVKGRESEYMVSKNMLNSIYGMMVEKPVRPTFMYVGGRFIKDDIDYISQVIDYNEKRDRFLYYPWGVYVTAYARHRLYDAIHTVGKRFIYCDTDSVKWKLTNSALDDKILEYFVSINQQAVANILEVTKRLKLPLEYTMPKDPDGETKVLGVWEREYVAKRFKTLGAKRYLYELDDGSYHLTVAGTNKASTLEYLKKLENDTGISGFNHFREDLVVPKEYAKRLVATYIDDDRIGYVTDYLGNRAFYNAPSGVHMIPASYTFNLTDDLRAELEAIMSGAEEDYGEIEE